MKIKIENTKIYVNSEYNKAFISKARYLQGEWESPYWVFPEDNREEVKELLLDTYGEADILEDEEQQKVTVEIDLEIYKDKKGARSELRLDNILLASRQYRDSYVKLADNVMVIQGGFKDSGGSRANPALCPEDNTILRIKNVPLSVYEKVKDEDGIRLVSEIDVTALKAEKERLLARIAEIDNMLKECGNSE